MLNVFRNCFDIKILKQKHFKISFFLCFMHLQATATATDTILMLKIHLDNTGVFTPRHLHCAYFKILTQKQMTKTNVWLRFFLGPLLWLRGVYILKKQQLYFGDDLVSVVFELCLSSQLCRQWVEFESWVDMILTGMNHCRGASKHVYSDSNGGPNHHHMLFVGQEGIQIVVMQV